MSAPTIVLITIFRESLIGGVAAHSSNLYERLGEGGHRVVRINYAGVFNHRTPWRKLRSALGTALRILRARLNGADIFHFHASNKALVYYAFGPLLALTGAHVLLSLHSGIGYDKWLKRHPAYDRVNRLLFPFLDRLVFMNPEERGRIAGRYPFLSERIVNVNPFIAPPDRWTPDLNDRPGRSETIRLAVSGGWETRYNLEDALRAAGKLHERTGRPLRLTLLLASVREDSPYRTRVEALIGELRRSIEVEVLHDRDDMLLQLSRQDVFLRTAHIDSYGLCVAESLLVGTPVVATDVCRRCAAARLYTDGDLDALVDQLEDIVNHPAETRRCLLDVEEDSFRGYLRIYSRLRREPYAEGMSTERPH